MKERGVKMKEKRSLFHVTFVNRGSLLLHVSLLNYRIRFAEMRRCSGWTPRWSCRSRSTRRFASTLATTWGTRLRRVTGSSRGAGTWTRCGREIPGTARWSYPYDRRLGSPALVHVLITIRHSSTDSVPFAAISQIKLIIITLYHILYLI